MNQFFIFGSLFDFCDIMCADLLTNPNIHYLNKPDCIDNRFLHLIFRLHNSGILNRIVKMPFRSVWYPHYFESKYISPKDNNIFLFFDSNPRAYNQEYLQWLKDKVPNSKLCLLFENSLCNRNFVDMDYFKKYFSLIMTTDENDANNNNIDFVHESLSKTYDTMPETSSVVCFVGGTKGRAELLLSCYRRLEGLIGKEKLDFTIVGLPNKMEGINSSPLSYREVMLKETSSKCLLEIVAGTQVGMTLRSTAAILYNKFLITNNKSIKSTPWYNENVLYIEKAEDITEEFVEKVISSEACYNYNGEFSPWHIIRHIERYYKLETCI